MIILRSPHASSVPVPSLSAQLGRILVLENALVVNHTHRGHLSDALRALVQNVVVVSLVHGIGPRDHQVVLWVSHPLEVVGLSLLHIRERIRYSTLAPNCRFFVYSSKLEFIARHLLVEAWNPPKGLLVIVCEKITVAIDIIRVVYWCWWEWRNFILAQKVGREVKLCLANVVVVLQVTTIEVVIINWVIHQWLWESLLIVAKISVRIWKWGVLGVAGWHLLLLGLLDREV